MNQRSFLDHLSCLFPSPYRSEVELLRRERLQPQRSQFRKAIRIARRVEGSDHGASDVTDTVRGMFPYWPTIQPSASPKRTDSYAIGKPKRRRGVGIFW